MNSLDKKLEKLRKYSRKFDQLHNSIEKQKYSLAKEFQNELKIAFKQFFAEVPNIEAFVLEFTNEEDDQCCDEHYCPNHLGWISFVGFIPQSLGFLAHKTGFQCDYNDAVELENIPKRTSCADDYPEERFKKEFSPQEIAKIKQIYSFIQSNQSLIVRSFAGYYNVMITKTGRIFTQ